MFRRKDEGLFDGDLDQNQSHNDITQDEKHSSQSSVNFSSMASGSSSATSSMSMASQSPAAPIVRPSAPVPAANSSFRPAVPPVQTQAADANRNRMPEAKPQTAPAVPSFAYPVGEKKGVKRVLTVGNDILLKGEIATCDRLVIEGKVDATLNDVHTVEIAECGSFKGAAQIEDAEISGLFEGELTVRGRLVIYATGKVRGRISYGEIEIERGGELSGDIKMSGGAATNAQRPIMRNNTTNVAKEEKVAA